MNRALDDKISQVNDEWTARLDELERSLPAIPAKTLAASRAVARRVNDVVEGTIRAATSRTKSVGDTASTAARTVGGQAGSAAGRTADSMASGAKTAVGQARAQSERAAGVVADAARTVAKQSAAEAEQVADVARSAAAEVAGQTAAQGERTTDAATRQIEEGLDEATIAADPDDLSEMTKAELYDRAQDLDIEGRSSMSKAELISAIRRA